MRCDPRLLSALADGELSVRRAERVRAHVDGCVACRRALGELEALRRELSRLPAVEGEDNWSVLVNRLAQDSRAPRPRRSPLGWRWGLPALALAVAAIAASGWLRWHKGRGLSDEAVIASAEAEFRAADAHYRRAVDELRVVAEKQRAAWTPPKRAQYEAAQAELEAAVAHCRAVAQERPADADAEELLFAAYRKEIRFYEDQLMREAR